MNTIKYLFAVGLLFILFGCEKSNIVDIPLPFEQEVVVQGQLIAGQTFQGIRITKTIPVNETFDITKAEIKDAFAYLKINNVKIVPLHYTSNGIYLPVSSLYVASGNIYELFGEANGRKFYSRTIIPKTPVIISSDYNSDQNYMEATIHTYGGEVYGSIWSIDRQDNTSAVDFYSIVSASSDDSIAFTRTAELPAEYQSSAYNGRRFIQVFALDNQFKDFFNSKDNNQPVSNYFTQGGGSIAWNVTGNHVIGLFIGIAKSHL